MEKEKRGELSIGPVSDDGLVWATSIERALYDAVVACIRCEYQELVLGFIPETVVPFDAEVKPDNGRERKPIQKVFFQFANLNLVDATSAPWEQIIEFRSDPAAREAFSNLKNFVFSRCKNLSQNQLRDKFNMIIEDYKLKSKEHGFSTFKSAIDVIINKRRFIDKASSGPMATLLAPQLGRGELELAGGSFVFDCEKAELAEAKRLREAEHRIRKHPANWVLMAQNRFSAPQAFEI